MNKILLLSITAFLLFFSSCKKEEVKVLPQSYQISESGLYPEGIAYSSSEEKIYVGSYYKGKIVTVDLIQNDNFQNQNARLSNHPKSYFHLVMDDNFEQIIKLEKKTKMYFNKLIILMVILFNVI